MKSFLTAKRVYSNVSIRTVTILGMQVQEYDLACFSSWQLRGYFIY